MFSGCVTTRLNSNGSGKSTFNRPSIVEPVIERVMFHAQFCRPCGKALFLAIECDQQVVSRVAALDGASSPTHIARLVVAIIINAIQGMTFGSIVGELRDVGKKGFKRMIPFFAHGYISRSIVGIRSCVGIGTSGNHGVIGVIQRMAGQTMT